MFGVFFVSKVRKQLLFNCGFIVNMDKYFFRQQAQVSAKHEARGIFHRPRRAGILKIRGANEKQTYWRGQVRIHNMFDVIKNVYLWNFCFAMFYYYSYSDRLKKNDYRGINIEEIFCVFVITLFFQVALE